MNETTSDIRRLLSERASHDGTTPGWEFSFQGPDDRVWGPEEYQRARDLSEPLRPRLQPGATVTLQAQARRDCQELKGRGGDWDIVRLDPRPVTAKVLAVQTRVCWTATGDFLLVTHPADLCRLEIEPGVSAQLLHITPIELPVSITEHRGELISNSPVALSLPDWVTSPQPGSNVIGHYDAAGVKQFLNGAT